MPRAGLRATRLDERFSKSSPPNFGRDRLVQSGPSRLEILPTDLKADVFIRIRLPSASRLIQFSQSSRAGITQWEAMPPRGSL